MIVLDTHAWIWLVSDPGRLGRRARTALRRDRTHGVAAVSCWEVATLAARGRIELDRDPVAWMEEALKAAEAELLPLTPAVAAASAALDGFHGDPADRLILATALTHGAALVTEDRRIHAHGVVRAVW